jgi:hypothetical protein
MHSVHRDDGVREENWVVTNVGPPQIQQPCNPIYITAHFLLMLLGLIPLIMFARAK